MGAEQVSETGVTDSELSVSEVVGWDIGTVGVARAEDMVEDATPSDFS